MPLLAFIYVFGMGQEYDVALVACFLCVTRGLLQQLLLMLLLSLLLVLLLLVYLLPWQLC